MSRDLGHEANPKLAKGPLGDVSNLGKLLQKNMWKPHFRKREGKKARAKGLNSVGRL